ncbi:hypothetical protein MKX01_015479 [Papaver californicum]|nr:hypothetical protein MKX01_015479 [Papaver californicum]
MSVYYKFKSGKEYHSIPALSPFIFGHGKDFDLILTNPSTNEDYTDDSILLPRNTPLLFFEFLQEEKDKEKEREKEVCQQPATGNVYVNNGSSAHQRGFGWPTSCFGQRGGGLERRIPPEGYTCHRCQEHCPTNGDPDYDKLVQGILTISRRVIDNPPELHCSICKDKATIISKSMCICGATEILVDDLIPNKTIRDTINRYIESGNISSGNTKSTITTEDVGSARSSMTKVPAPTPSWAPKAEKMPSCSKEETVFTVDGKPLSPGDLFWGTSQADYSMMPFGTSAYNNPYWSDMQCGTDGFMNPYIGMYTQNQNPYCGGPGYALPCATSQTKKRSRVTPCGGSDWSHVEEELNYKKQRSWQASSVSCYAK